MTAPTRPPFECGKTEPRIISHRVAPKARAASFSPGGVVAITSRDSDVMIGVIITAKMMPAVMNERACGFGPKIQPSTGMPWNHDDRWTYTFRCIHGPK